MTQVHARINRDGRSSLENVLIDLEVQTPRDGLGSWRGRFRAPLQADFSIGDELRIALADGRSGKAFVNHVSQGSLDDGAQIVFRGTGPLE